MSSFLKNSGTSFICLLLSFIVCEQASASSIGVPQSKVYGKGSVVTTYLSIDSTGTPSVIGSTGSVSSDPSTWKNTNLTDSLTYVGISQPPHLFSNAKGDVVIIWEYINLSSNFMVAVAMLPAESITWNIQTISNTTMNSQNMDTFVSISEVGDTIAIWTAIDPKSGNTVALCSTTIISSSPTWSAPQIASAL